MIPLTCGPREVRCRGRRCNGRYQGLGEGRWGASVYGHRVSVWEDEKVLGIDCGDVSAICELYTALYT